MGLWIGGKKTWWWPFGVSHWTYSPYLLGNDDPNKPPPSVAAKSYAGSPYSCPRDGKNYPTWRVPSPDGQTQQEIVDWSSPL